MLEKKSEDQKGTDRTYPEYRHFTLLEDLWLPKIWFVDLRDAQLLCSLPPPSDRFAVGRQIRSRHLSHSINLLGSIGTHGHDAVTTGKNTRRQQRYVGAIHCDNGAGLLVAWL